MSDAQDALEATIQNFFQKHAAGVQSPADIDAIVMATRAATAEVNEEAAETEELLEHIQTRQARPLKPAQPQLYLAVDNDR